MEKKKFFVLTIVGILLTSGGIILFIIPQPISKGTFLSPGGPYFWTLALILCIFGFLFLVGARKFFKEWRKKKIEVE